MPTSVFAQDTPRDRTDRPNTTQLTAEQDHQDPGSALAGCNGVSLALPLPPSSRGGASVPGVGWETVQTHDLNAPRAVPRLVGALRRRFLELGFTEDGIRGVNTAGGTADPWSLVAGQPAADSSPLSTLLTLFWFGAPVEAGQVQAALEPVGLADLEALGVAEIRDGHVRPRCIIRPLDGLLVASDLPAG